jgi:8-oxo-dGTP diphosphatase
MQEQGTHFARYRVIPRTLIFLFHEDEILLLKGAPHKKIWAGYYNGIGGHVEPGEDVLACAIRELHEEAGISDVHLHLCASVLVDTGEDPGVTLFVFKGEAAHKTVIASHEGTPEWIPLNDVLDLKLVHDLYKLIPRVHQWQPGDEVMFARYSYSSEGELKVSFNSTD